MKIEGVQWLDFRFKWGFDRHTIEVCMRNECKTLGVTEQNNGEGRISSYDSVVKSQSNKYSKKLSWPQLLQTLIHTRDRNGEYILLPCSYNELIQLIQLSAYNIVQVISICYTVVSFFPVFTPTKIRSIGWDENNQIAYN